MLTEWPDRFVYVCSAGRAALVNALPLVYSGFQRVHAVIIFCGASGPDTTDATEQQNALDPATRLENFLVKRSQGRISRQAGNCITVYGDPDDMTVWSAKMTDALRDAAGPAGPLPIVFNLKGGMKEMALGGLISLMTTGYDRSMLVTVPGDPADVRCFDTHAQRALPMQGTHLTLQEYLHLYGFCEHEDPEPSRQRARFEDLCARQAQQIDAFGRAFLPHATEAWPLLQEMTADLEPDRQAHGAPSDHRQYRLGRQIIVPPPAAHNPQRAVVARALAGLTGFPGIDVTCDDTGACSQFRVNCPFVARLLRGAWLEAVIYLALRRMAVGQKDVSIAANLGLAHPSNPDRRVAELDAVILIRSQLHIIEAKSSVMTAAAARRSNERSLAQTDSMKLQLVGQMGKALIVNPCVEQDHLTRSGGGILTRARQTAQEMFLGPTAIDLLIERLKSMLG